MSTRITTPDRSSRPSGRSRLQAAATGAMAVAMAAALFAFRPAAAAERRELTVFAASSVREAFEKLAAQFEATHANVKVRLSFAGSQDLRVQIEHGAPFDVFASADERPIAALQEKRLVLAPTVFARNQPVLAVPLANPAKIARFSDLPSAERIVLGANEVPIGAYAEIIVASANRVYGHAFGTKVMAHVRSRELNTRQVLAKVALGEADAAIVYKTDALTAKDRVLMIPIPDGINITASYAVALAPHTTNADLARAWVEMLLAGDGQGILASAGFLPPSPPRTERRESRK
jgi:molybdate transport system substrate-binding protein